jgi:ADP-heptose:LPS heptosyltransferase
MNREKHLFIQNKYYNYSSLGDVCMEIFAYDVMVKNYNLDAKFIIQTNSIYDEIWFDVFGKNNIYRSFDDVPDEYKFSKIHRPTDKDVGYGQWASNDLIEGLIWENGFLDTKNIIYKMPLLYKSNFVGRNVLIYPEEKTDGNKVFDSNFWINVYNDLKKQNYKIFYLGNKTSSVLTEFYDKCKFDVEYSPSVSNLKKCIEQCTLSVGTSTGPTWFCLFSDIRQIVFQSKSNARYWNFDRYEFSLLKNIKTIQTFESTLRDLIIKEVK